MRVRRRTETTVKKPIYIFEGKKTFQKEYPTLTLLDTGGGGHSGPRFGNHMIAYLYYLKKIRVKIVHKD